MGNRKIQTNKPKFQPKSLHRILQFNDGWEVTWGPLWTTLQAGTDYTYYTYYTYYIAIKTNKMLGYMWNEMRRNTENKNQDVSAGWCFLACACCMSHLPPRKWTPKVSVKESCYTLCGIWKTTPIKIWNLKRVKFETYCLAQESNLWYMQRRQSQVLFSFVTLLRFIQNQ